MKQTMSELISLRFGRRDILSMAGGAVLASCAPKKGQIVQPRLPQMAPSFDFESLPPTLDSMHHVSDGYEVDIVLSWGDPLFATDLDTPFDANNLTAEQQNRRFGYNNDFIACFEQSNGNIILSVNHESSIAQLMFSGEKEYCAENEANCPVEMMAHGLSIVELRKENDSWQVVYDSPYNRRITAHTPFALSGPVAGHRRMQTPEDPTGRIGKGTIHNCSGGKTPWGTILTCEENILYYFMGERAGTEQEASYNRYNIAPPKGYLWAKLEPRFRLDESPNEPNRFGWVLEIDPLRPDLPPIKRTALGRMYHESANPILSTEGRVVIYMGDDGYFEYLYRYVSDDVYTEGGDTSALLDKGVLSVAKFNNEGTLEWLPLIHGQGPLTAENGFHDQGDVLIDARRAGDLLQATPMDRCEDVEPNLQTGKIYINCTKNPKRGQEGRPSTDGPNPRENNEAGHILELTPVDGHTADTMRWDILLLAGKDGQYGIRDGSDVLGCPDNACTDPQHRLWISTDGSEDSVGFCDALYAVETSPPFRGFAKRFFSAPLGAEITGPCFHSSGKYLFLSVQHPGSVYGGEGPTRNYWPDFSENMPARPSVVCIRRTDGGIIAGTLPKI